MQIDATQSNSIKLRVMEQFYGLEEYLDMPEPLPEMLTKLDTAESEFGLITAISNLDIWFVRITNNDDSEVWSPFKETLASYAKRHDLLTAHLFAEKQYSNAEILRFLKLTLFP